MLYVWGYSKLNISYFSFTLAITCSNSIVWKHFKSIVVGFCARKISSYSILEDIDVLAPITCSSGENVTRELNGLSWAKPLLHISVPWSPGQFFMNIAFFMRFHLRNSRAIYLECFQTLLAESFMFTIFHRCNSTVMVFP